MTIHLPEELESFVHDAVKAGLYPREDDVIRDALTRLRQSVSAESTGAKTARRLDDEAFRRQLLASGLVTQFPDPAEDIDDEDDPPVSVEGEPLSETIIRERR